MKFNEIYNESIQLWIEDIDVSDGRLIKETDGFYSENLSVIWNKADESTCNEWQSLMVWIIYQEIHKKAIECFRNGKMLVEINSIDILTLKEKYLNALHDEGYEEMLKDFEK